jgi:hypothetical protein
VYRREFEQSSGSSSILLQLNFEFLLFDAARGPTRLAVAHLGDSASASASTSASASASTNASITRDGAARTTCGHGDGQQRQDVSQPWTRTGGLPGLPWQGEYHLARQPRLLTGARGCRRAPSHDTVQGSGWRRQETAKRPDPWSVHGMTLLLAAGTTMRTRCPAAAGQAPYQLFLCINRDAVPRSRVLREEHVPSGSYACRP